MKIFGFNVNATFKGMKEIIGNRANEIIITLVVFCLGLLCFHLVTDDYAFFMGSLAARQFSDFAYFDVHFQGFIGIREVYKLLYYLMPRINWHFIFMMVYGISSLYLVLRTLRLVVLKKVSSLFFIRVIQVLFALFYIENIVFVSHTRVSLIFCGIALFNLAFIKDITRKRVVLNSLVFIFGMLLRPESSIGMLLIVGAGYFIYTLNVKQLLQRIWIPVLATAVFFTVFAIDWAYTDIYVRKVEPEIEYKMMAKRVVDIGQMKTAQDSIKYRASLKGMWFDVKEMTPSFMRSIILPGSDMNIAHMKDVLVHVEGFYDYYLFVYAVIISLLIMGLLFLSDYKVRVTRIFIFQLCTGAIIFVLDYNGFLVSYRHFISLQFISLFIMCFYFFDAPAYKPGVSKGIWGTLALLFLFGGLFLTLIKYKEQNTVVNDKVNLMERTMKEFEHRYSNRIVAVTIDGRFLFDQHFSLINENYTRNTYLMFDWFTFSLTPRYVNYLSSQCGCDANDPAAFFRWLSANHALYVADPYRFDITEHYLNIVHGCNVKFIQPVKINSLAGIENSETREGEIRTVCVVAN